MADPNFGKNIDWDTLFFDLNKNMVVTPDGTIFVSNRKQHNIFKFSKSGELIKKIGQLGRGPTDLYFPGWLSTLSDKYLLVEEYGLDLRMSLFDFEGKCINIIKTKTPFSFPIALKSNKIAYLTYQFGSEKNFPIKMKNFVVIKDILSGDEKVIDTIELLDRSAIKFGPDFGMSFGTFNGEVFISRTKDGDLLVGVSNSPEIIIFAKDGKKIKSFKLNITPQPTTKDYINRFKKLEIDELKNNRRYSRGDGKERLRKIEAYDFGKFFEEYLPYYRRIVVDSEGNILVFKWDQCLINCPIVFQVYSQEGKYICETRIDPGIYDFNLDRKFKNIEFTETGIFGLFQLKGSEDISLRLVKINWN